ncbi:twin-arginine translocation signal domain-containing protein [Azospirillum halopraeferens]|uniref:twin-arginine translocation signal domain-containing protein n=1 Tax=Azospirillum halopraeferens TaxID=34010 RepID=UPI000418E137|nr:twin-arginine translocation signal domain-containing protein [Azospirillum halopraeferens]
MNRNDDSTPDRAKAGGPARRDLLKGAGLAGIGAATLAALPGEADAYQPPADQVATRYRKSEHVKRFYFLNRL